MPSTTPHNDAPAPAGVTSHSLEKLAYSVKEAVVVTSLSKSTIYNHIAARRLDTRRIGGRTVIPAASLRRLIEGEAA